MKDLLEGLQLPNDAVKWLMTIYSMAQTFDDYADGDKVSRKQLDSLIWDSFIAAPMNPFFMQHSSSLWSLVATAILKWQASNKMEQSGKADAMSFIWRAGFYDIVLFVYAICHGQEAANKNADTIMQLYGEKLEDYLQEVNNA